jgi:hypothetical protein
MRGVKILSGRERAILDENPVAALRPLIEPTDFQLESAACSKK